MGFRILPGLLFTQAAATTAKYALVTATTWVEKVEIVE